MRVIRVEQKSKYKSISKFIIICIFVAYIAIIFKIVVFKYPGSIHIFSTRAASLRRLNLIPFKLWVDFFENASSLGWAWAISNLFGNIIIFIPLGYLLPLILKKAKSILPVACMSFVFSLVLESLQYVLAIGSSDIDDIILNTLGGVIGYLCYKVVTKILVTNKKICIGTITLTVLFLVSGFTVAKAEFGNMIGITKFEHEVIGGDVIPESRVDYIGAFISYDANIINMYDGMIVDSNVDTSLMEKLNVKVNEDTKIYLNTMESKKNKMTTEYNEYTDSVSSIEKNSTLSIWGKKVEGKIVAEIIVIQKPIINQEGSTISHTEDKRNKKTTDNKSKDDIQIPEAKSDIEGCFKEYENAVITINRIDNFESGESTISVSSDNKVKIKVQDDTNYIIKVITSAGEVRSIKSTSIDDMKKGDKLDVWGESSDGALIADKIVIIRME
ncbi:VanZ family protein [Clostridium sp. CM027]|uniref:VanZ family protein n=1 Tax=Clostridium sp. CM027 TaxID=2849865 RepID=UPI001C6ED379|nr:VanZ family protein [Clostridium sp. CM027]MBW9146780.1 VanZ family protein [Clostridium sp. CM027]UVE41565.1 VanZ family protein [Clostridium sp. CM027]